jgi:hypothetical protein
MKACSSPRLYPKEVGPSLGEPKGGWVLGRRVILLDVSNGGFSFPGKMVRLFPWACLEMMIIPMDVSRKDDHSFVCVRGLAHCQAQCARGLAYCQAQSWLGLTSVRHSASSLKRAYILENLYL